MIASRTALTASAAYFFVKSVALAATASVSCNLFITLNLFLFNILLSATKQLRKITKRFAHRLFCLVNYTILRNIFQELFEYFYEKILIFLKFFIKNHFN